MSYPARCIDCGYVLIGLPAGKCPECGRDFDPERPVTFTTKPPFVWWSYWLPGFLLAAIGGALIYAMLILFVGWSWSAAIVTPFCIGAIVGYGCRVRPIVRAIFALAAIGAAIVGMYSTGLVGVFCGFVLVIVALIPLLVGTAIGYMLRLALRESLFEQRWHLPALGLFLALALAASIDRATMQPHAIESVITSIQMPVPVGRAWNAVMFYEEVHHPPPFLLRIGLPRPLRTYGKAESVGDVKFCIYNKGRLAKHVTRREPQKLLAFDVIVQDRIENHSIRLTDGSFAFQALGENQTQVALTTSYQPKLGPRWIWRPAEELAVHTLHRYVLDGMQQKATEP